VAKKRRPARSTRKAASTRRPAKRKAAARKPARRAPTRAYAGAAPTSLNLKVLREHIALAVSALSMKVASSSTVEAKLDDTRRRLSQWMTDIDDICTPQEQEVCGETMDLPFP
jgi:hypothetical protein